MGIRRKSRSSSVHNNQKKRGMGLTDEVVKKLRSLVNKSLDGDSVSDVSLAARLTVEMLRSKPSLSSFKLLLRLGGHAMALNREKYAHYYWKTILELPCTSPSEFFFRLCALDRLGRLQDRNAELSHGFSLWPDSVELHEYQLISAQEQLCDWRQYEDSLDRCISAIKSGWLPSELGFVWFHRIDLPDVYLRFSALEHENRFGSVIRSRQFPVAQPGGRIRIGYFSSDFRNHAVSVVAVEIFELHDPSRFEVHAFAFGRHPKDEYTERVRSGCEFFHEAYDLDDDQLLKLSRSCHLDIAIDLNGYTQDDRLAVFAKGCAPIQVHYLGYPGTLGGDVVDYFIADRQVVTPRNRPFFSEKMVYMPDCYQVNDTKRRISDTLFTREQCGLPSDAFVFCSFNSPRKLHPAMFACWMRILKTVSGSVLWIYARTENTRAYLRAHAADCGIEPDRIIFAESLPNSQHLARLALADLFLDSFPYCAHGTASDTLFAGLPLLTLRGESFQSRVSASLLICLGLVDLVTDSMLAYEALAVHLANNPSTLASYRNRLKEAVQTSPLFKGEVFTRHLERAYEHMVHRHRSGLLPTDIDVADLSDCVSGTERVSVIPPLDRLLLPQAAFEKKIKTRLVVATRTSESDFRTQTATGRSLKLTENPFFEPRIFYENTRGLSSVYNQAILECGDETVILVFAHDDLHLLDFFWCQRLECGLKQFDVVGVVGNKNRIPGQPSWYFKDTSLARVDRENLSGTVAHGTGFPPRGLDRFGPSGQQVMLLDGLLLAVNSRTLQENQLFFDEQFDFHFYDLDFCRQAELKGLSCGTVELSLMHESTGSFESDHWRQGYERYLEKWKE